MSKIKDKVAQILFKYPQTRDCNYKLYGNFLHFYHPEVLVGSVKDYLIGMTEEKYVKLETITRCSRQIQEKYPHLRGKEWEQRQRMVKPVQENLGYNTK